MQPALGINIGLVLSDNKREAENIDEFSNTLKRSSISARVQNEHLLSATCN